MINLPSPCFIVDEGLLIKNLRILRGVADAAGCKILLAQKAFSMFDVYPLAAKYLDGTAASGLHEARLSHEYFGKENHVFSAAYSDAEFDAVSKICSHIVFNSFAQARQARQAGSERRGHMSDATRSLGARQAGSESRGHMSDATRSLEARQAGSERRGHMSDATRSLEAGINSGGGIGGGINADTGRRSEVESKKNNAGGNLHRCKNFGIRVNPEFSTQENSGADGGIYDPCSPGSRLGVTLENFRFDAFSDDARSGAAFDDVRSNDAPSEDASSVGASSGACSNDTPSDDAPPFGARSDEFSNGEHESIRLNGLHFHTLCQQNSDALEATLHAVTEKFGSVFDKISWVNFGGGHHITRPDYDIDRLVALIKNFRAKYPHLQVYLEPGEAVALNAGFLHCTVLDIVQNGGNIAILDASAACHMPDVLEMPYTPRVVAPQVADGGFAYTLAGPTCLAGDIIGAYSFEKPLSVGDTVVFDDMAIYSMVKTNTFNGMNLPAIAKRRADGEVQIVRQFGYDDFKNRLS